MEVSRLSPEANPIGYFADEKSSDIFFLLAARMLSGQARRGLISIHCNRILVSDDVVGL
jgi:hypothetical protein